MDKLSDNLKKIFLAGIGAAYSRSVFGKGAVEAAKFLAGKESRSQAAPIVQVHPILLTPPVRPNNAKEAYNRYSQEQDEPHKAPPQKR